MDNKHVRCVVRAAVTAALAGASALSLIAAGESRARAADACQTLDQAVHFHLSDGTRLVATYGNKVDVGNYIVKSDGSFYEAKPGTYKLANGDQVVVQPDNAVTFPNANDASWVQATTPWIQYGGHLFADDVDVVTEGSFVTKGGLSIFFVDTNTKVQPYAVDAKGNRTLLKDGSYSLDGVSSFKVANGLVEADSLASFFCYANEH